MASLETDMVACPERSATYFITLGMLHDRISLKVFNVAVPTCARTGMTTGQIRAAGNRASVSVLVHILVTIHLDRVATAGNHLINDNLALNGVEILHKI